MQLSSKTNNALTLLGDALILVVSLWLALLVRNRAFPSVGLFYAHLLPCLLLFFLSISVFFIVGLYERRLGQSKANLFSRLVRAQIANALLSIVFFYFMPNVGITPKTILFVYVLISSLLFTLWRLGAARLFAMRKRTPAILVGSGDEMRDLFARVNKDQHYPLRFISCVDLEKSEATDLEIPMQNAIRNEGPIAVVIDLNDQKITPLLPQLYHHLFSEIQFLDFYAVYEDVFDRIPLSLVDHSWFLENVSTTPNVAYDMLKRTMDLAIGLAVAIPSLLIYPLVILLIKMEDGGPIFVVQERIGQKGRPFRLLKFRSMSFNDSGNQSQVKTNKITKVGAWIRTTRVDELPQLWNVLRGDLSLIGPRPELPALTAGYERQIPYYQVRHVIKPGLSGWAQVYHHDPPKVTADTERTRVKLAYDLYYVKNRSLFLDLMIALQTIRVLSHPSGR